MRSLAVPIALLAAAVTPLHGQGQGCADTKYPPELPPPSALVDSAHAIADLAAFADPSKPMLFSVVFNQGDSVALARRSRARAIRRTPGELTSAGRSRHTECPRPPRCQVSLCPRAP